MSIDDKVLDSIYPLIAEEWTYLPASKDEWLRAMATIIKAYEAAKIKQPVDTTEANK